MARYLGLSDRTIGREWFSEERGLGFRKSPRGISHYRREMFIRSDGAVVVRGRFGARTVDGTRCKYGETSTETDLIKRGKIAPI